MAQRIETITQHVFAFDPWEIHQIYTALRESGYDDLADEIEGEMDDDCECECEWESECEKAEKEAYDSFQEDVTANRQTVYKVNGDDNYKDFVSGLIEEIYAQSKDGRVIIERGL